ncbi:MAG: arsenic transporter [Acidobacteriia bacterium]|nr:arsenic transporter [Terriglobia bacterium]
MSSLAVWVIAAGAIAGILLRPKEWPEAVWTCLGAFLLVISGLLPWPKAVEAIAKGTDVYLFLAGMMLLAELGRRTGVFDWLAALAVRASKGSHARLFRLVYLVGIVVTVFLSNDATAVVLTPAVYAAVKKARAEPLPYLLICAFVANAASFVLPISNPANLVVYRASLPPLVTWLRLFFVPSVCSIAATYLVLQRLSRGAISGGAAPAWKSETLSPKGRVALWGIAGSATVMIGASALRADLGLPACAAAIIAVLLATGPRAPDLRAIGSGVSWSVLPLVAGLFVLVEGLNRAGALMELRRLMEACASLPRAIADLTASFGVVVLSNLMNNLPSGLLVGSAVRSGYGAAQLRDAVLVGVDLGPNLSVTGSLATVLWLIALRREGEQISSRQFLKVGALVMPPALILATLSLSLLRG